jgi:hypothetical protein
MSHVVFAVLIYGQILFRCEKGIYGQILFSCEKGVYGQNLFRCEKGGTVLVLN